MLRRREPADYIPVGGSRATQRQTCPLYQSGTLWHDCQREHVTCGSCYTTFADMAAWREHIDGTCHWFKLYETPERTLVRVQPEPMFRSVVLSLWRALLHWTGRLSVLSCVVARKIRSAHGSRD